MYRSEGATAAHSPVPARQGTSPLRLRGEGGAYADVASVLSHALHVNTSPIRAGRGTLLPTVEHASGDVHVEPAAPAAGEARSSSVLSSAAGVGFLERAVSARIVVSSSGDVSGSGSGEGSVGDGGAPSTPHPPPLRATLEGMIYRGKGNTTASPPTRRSGAGGSGSGSPGSVAPSRGGASPGSGVGAGAGGSPLGGKRPTRGVGASPVVTSRAVPTLRRTVSAAAPGPSTRGRK